MSRKTDKTEYEDWPIESLLSEMRRQMTYSANRGGMVTEVDRRYKHLTERSGRLDWALSRMSIASSRVRFLEGLLSEIMVSSSIQMPVRVHEKIVNALSNKGIGN